MLIPQARIGIAERRRPDFALYVPLNYWHYEKLAVELDGAHSDLQRARDDERNRYLETHGYTVVSARPADGRYLEEVRKLVEEVERLMNLVHTAPYQGAQVVASAHFEEDERLPF